jgi:hypothetical protein
MPGDQCDSPVGLLSVDGGVEPRSIRPLRVLGTGRAAEARLVAATLADGRELVCVEKVFRPALLTRAIYRVCFQSPFPYQFSADAIRACFYRRRVAAAIVRAVVPDADVAMPLYVRWHATDEAMVLGSEYIAGRGIVPAATDSHMLRRWLVGKFSRRQRYPAKPHEEIAELLDVMTRLEKLFRDCGLTGTGWQVCKRAIVSTANLLRTPRGYVSVDLESGIPAVLVPAYLLAGLGVGSLPLFDDLDAPRLHHWLTSHRAELAERLSAADLAQLDSDVGRLIEHTRAWKEAEPALGRRPWRLLGRSFRQSFKSRTIEIWQRRDIIDATTADRIRGGRRILSRLVFLLGLMPAESGRFLQRLWANASYRAKVGRFLRDTEYRRAKLQGMVDADVDRWRERGRIAPTQTVRGIGVVYFLHVLLAAITPAALHRWLVDDVHRRNVLARIMLICVSPRFQREYGRHLIRSCIHAWEHSERLAAVDAARLRHELDSGEIDEYVRCFGMHLGLKLLLPLLVPLKVGGIAAFVASHNPLYLLPILVAPALRTAITLWRMIATRRPVADFADALVVGTLPVVGSLAYPVQMYSKHRELSCFLLRDSAARLGRWLPIYGGRDSRLEILAIKLVNLVAEAMEVGLSITSPLRRLLSRASSTAPAAPRLAGTPAGPWHRLADEQLRLISQDSATPQPTSSVPEQQAKAA